MTHLRFPVAAGGICGAVLALSLFSLTNCSSSEERAQSYYEHGKTLMAAHDYERAEIEFRNAVNYNKKLLPAWRGLVEVDEHQQKFAALGPSLRKILELDPADTEARLKLGRLLVVRGNLNDALKVVNDAKDPDDQNADLVALKGAILLKLNDTDGAVREARAALKTDPANTTAMLVLASNAFAHGDPQGALTILNNDALAKKNDLGVDIFRLQILEKTNDLSKAEALLRRLEELYPKDAGFKKELIKLYVYQRRYDDAEKEQRSVIALQPDNFRAQMDLIQLLNITRGPDVAQAELQKLIAAGGNVFPYQIALAQFEYAQDKHADAETLLKKLINDNSSADNVKTAQLALAQLYLGDKKIDAASSVIDDILKKDSRNVDGLKLRASILLDRGELEGAIADLRQALNDQPRKTDLMLMLAIAYERSGSIDLAEKEFADAMRVSNFDPSVSLSYVTFLERRGSVAHAEDVLTDLASRWPKNVAVLSSLAQVRLSRQNWAGAEQVAEMIRKLGTNEMIGNELLGAALAGRNKIDESLVALQNAYQSAPDAAGPMDALVRGYLQAKKPDQAIAFLQSVLKANPSNAEAYALLGSVQLSTRSIDQARQNFAMAIQKQPANPVGYQALANFYIQQKNYDEAGKVIRDGLQQQPDSLALGLTLAGIMELTSDYEGAIAEYEKLLTKNPGSIAVANNLASLLADHRTDKESLERAKTLAPILRRSPLAQFKDTLGWVNYRQGDYKAALPLLEEAATALPKVAIVHYHLGMAYLASGQPDKASEQFKFALNQSPDHDLQDKLQAAITKTRTQ
jgi:tetratricopeptide (TPR) repeat protein